MTHRPHEAWELLLSFVQGSTVKTESREATVKMLKTIRSDHRVQRRYSFAFGEVVWRSLRLEDNLSNMMTNSDLCDAHRCLFRQFPLQAKENVHQYECLHTQYLACTATISIVLQLYYRSIKLYIHIISFISLFKCTMCQVTLGSHCPMQHCDTNVKINKIIRINALRCRFSHILSRAHQLLLLCLPYQCHPPMVTKLAGSSDNPCCQPWW